MTKACFLLAACVGGALLWPRPLPAAPPAHAVTVTPTTPAGLKRAIAAQKGHVVVVNFWATWCGPCVAEYPRLVKLYNRYKGQGLVVLAVSADSRRDVPTKVKPFLARQGAAFPQYLQASTDIDDFVDGFDPSWQGDYPRTYVYDRRGHLARVLPGELTDRTLRAAVVPLLGPARR